MQILNYINEIKHISTHEHLGAINPIGFSNVLPYGSTVDHIPGVKLKYTPKLIDLIMSPYLGSMINKSANKQLDISNWQELKPILVDLRGTGLYQSLNTGMKALYGISLDDVIYNNASINKLNELISDFYDDGFFSSSSKVFETLNVQKALKPVHINYLFAKAESQAEYNKEKQLFTPILRVDDMFGHLDVNGILDFSYLYDMLDVEINNVDDIEKMVNKVFDKIDRMKICAIKQLQAYGRSLYFSCITKSECVIAFNNMKNGSLDNARKVQDYIMHLILGKANERKLPYQIHTGMARLSDSNPSLLENLIREYSNVKFVLLHCYPFIDNANYLAGNYANVYVDTAWLGLQSNDILYDALNKYIGFLPASKIFMSSDATNLEEFAGCQINSREVTARVMTNKIKVKSLDMISAKDYIYKIFRGNANRIYFNDNIK